MNLTDKLEGSEMLQVPPKIVWGKHIGIGMDADNKSIRELYGGKWHAIIPVEVFKLPEGLVGKHKYIIIDEKKDGRDTLLRDAAIRLRWDLPIRINPASANLQLYNNLIECYKKMKSITGSWVRIDPEKTLVYH